MQASLTLRLPCFTLYPELKPNIICGPWNVAKCHVFCMSPGREHSPGKGAMGRLPPPLLFDHTCFCKITKQDCIEQASSGFLCIYNLISCIWKIRRQTQLYKLFSSPPSPHPQELACSGSWLHRMCLLSLTVPGTSAPSTIRLSIWSTLVSFTLQYSSLFF